MATSIAVRPISKVAAHDFARDLDLTDDELTYLLDLAGRVKRAPSKFSRALSGKYISLLFEKPSLRTRLTFELAIKQLGGDSVTCEGPVGAREDSWTAHPRTAAVPGSAGPTRRQNAD